MLSLLTDVLVIVMASISRSGSPLICHLLFTKKIYDVWRFLWRREGPGNKDLSAHVQPGAVIRENCISSNVEERKEPVSPRAGGCLNYG